MGNISEATIAMDFTEIADGQRCGLACMGKENKVLGIKNIYTYPMTQQK